MPHLWKKVQDEIVDEKKHLQKKHKHYFGSQSKISRFQTTFTKSLNSYERVMGFSNCAQTFTPLKYLS